MYISRSGRQHKGEQPILWCVIRLFFVLILSLALSGCREGSSDQESKKLVDIQIATKSGGSIDVIAKGQSDQLVATGVFSDGTTVDLTQVVSWKSSNSSIATVSDSGLVTGLKDGQVKISSSDDDVKSANTLTIDVGQASLKEIQITPPLNVLPLGFSQQLVATGIYTNNSTKDLSKEVLWSSSSKNVKVKKHGRVVAVAEGRADVTAYYKKRKLRSNNAAKFKVAKDRLESIEIVPDQLSIALGTTGKVEAFAHFSSGERLNITHLAHWVSAGTAEIVKVRKLGHVKGKLTGSTSLVAKYHHVKSQNSVHIKVTPAVLQDIEIVPPSLSMPIGYSRDLTAIGLFNDKSSQEISQHVRWHVEDSNVALVKHHGKLSALAQGATHISARSGNVASSATLDLEVTGAALSEIQITPNYNQLPAGSAKQLKAIGVFNDGSTKDLTSTVSWVSDNINIATVNSSGLVTGVLAGKAHVKAFDKHSGLSGSVAANIYVTAAKLKSIEIFPPSVVMSAGETYPVTAVASYSNLFTEDVTARVSWKSSNTRVASVDDSGLLHAGMSGNTRISAYDEYSNVASISNSEVQISSAELRSIQIAPQGASVAQGYPIQLSAIGHFADGTSRDITQAVSWHSDNLSVVEVELDGIAIGSALGTANLAAKYRGSRTLVSKPIPLTVTGSVLSKLVVQPNSINIPKGYDAQLHVEGTFSSTSKPVAMIDVSWSSSDIGVASVSEDGVITGNAAGSTTVAAYDSRSGISSEPIAVAVNDSDLAELNVTPNEPQLALGAKLQLSAVATFNDGTIKNVTNSLSWISDNPDITMIDTVGVAYAVGKGITNIYAFDPISEVKSDTITFTVTDATFYCPAAELINREQVLAPMMVQPNDSDLQDQYQSKGQDKRWQYQLKLTDAPVTNLDVAYMPVSSMDGERAYCQYRTQAGQYIKYISGGTYSSCSSVELGGFSGRCIATNDSP
ncbi:Ig-like domain-containing protein [Vibrio sp. S4M6]|uniref:Ig-like domain-containing protein n=1 Tax=Vibrio sinus TaxID=2946865 RepID=UPI002029F781|nr:Ig-like domain-containing protein [Vibrio sinus]MCL9781993.1 Ig-like domain-containing protein [Vibrio sinus]